jgi:hypothetical protein
MDYALTVCVLCGDTFSRDEDAFRALGEHDTIVRAMADLLMDFRIATDGRAPVCFECVLTPMCDLIARHGDPRRSSQVAPLRAWAWLS